MSGPPVLEGKLKKVDLGVLKVKIANMWAIIGSAGEKIGERKLVKCVFKTAIITGKKNFTNKS